MSNKNLKNTSILEHIVLDETCTLIFVSLGWLIIVLMIIVGFQKKITELEDAAINKNYAEKVIENNKIVFKWK